MCFDEVINSLSLRTLLDEKVKEKKEKVEKKVEVINDVNRDWKCEKVVISKMMIISVVLLIINRIIFAGNVNLINKVKDLFVLFYQSLLIMFCFSPHFIKSYFQYWLKTIITESSMKNNNYNELSLVKILRRKNKWNKI